VKPLYALAAQHYGILTPEQTQYCSGIFILPGNPRPYHDDKKGGHGNLNMRQAIAASCDVYFFKVAEKLGIEKMASFMTAFGYGVLTGIDIPGEKAGLMASPEWKKRVFKKKADQVWFPGETISMGIGQGPITVTPLQQAHFAAEIAEEGKIIAVPRLVAGVRPAGSTEVARKAPQMMKPVDLATDEQWQVVHDGMQGAVSPGGTAYQAGVGAQYKFAGKTGTAQVFTLKENQKYKASEVEERLRDHAWFIAYAPADDPKIAVSVLVENGGFGAAAAAPIARKVLDAYLLGPDAVEAKKPAPKQGG
jgi:penicillin-binding protein 2